MVNTVLQFQSVSDDIIRFFDTWNILGAAGVILIGVVTFTLGGFTPQSVLVAVTGLYAYIAFNQMRESRWNRRPPNSLAVRPHFPRESDKDACDFGLQNFGESPALNLRLKAILREGNDIVDTLTVSAKNRHLHLEEDGFHSLITEAVEDQSFGNLANPEDPIFENYQQKSIELYYTFESNDGVQYPRAWHKPTKMEMDEVVEKSESPRTVELAEIREKCTPGNVREAAREPI